jgi:hypothetical protein
MSTYPDFHIRTNTYIHFNNLTSTLTCVAAAYLSKQCINLYTVNLFDQFVMLLQKFITHICDPPALIYIRKLYNYYYK